MLELYIISSIFTSEGAEDGNYFQTKAQYRENRYNEAKKFDKSSN